MIEKNYIGSNEEETRDVLHRHFVTTIQSMFVVSIISSSLPALDTLLITAYFFSLLASV